jgi:2-oxoglutarate ferredoxin oxidoreductase subunit beta
VKVAASFGVQYAARGALHGPEAVSDTKRKIKRGLACQRDGLGFSLIEILSPCPTNWGLPPQKALEWLRENMIPHYPLGVFRDKGED